MSYRETMIPALTFVVILIGTCMARDPDEKPTLQVIEGLVVDYERAVSIAIRACNSADVDDRTKVASLHLLGILRARRACPLLVDKLLYRSFWDATAELHPLAGFPAARALVEIGEPAVRQIVARTTREMSQQEMLLSAHVLQLVYAPDGTAALVPRLKAALRQREARGSKADDVAFVNLAELIRTCETTDFSLVAEWPSRWEWNPHTLGDTRSEAK